MQWTHTEVPEEALKALCSEKTITPLLAKLLYQRGLTEVADTLQFLNPRLAHLQDPFAIKHLEAGARRLIHAIEQQQQVCVLGDYDVDGVTSTTLLITALTHLGLTPWPFIPKRMEEGYGLSKRAIERLLSIGKPDLMVVLDSGTNAAAEVQFLQDQGIDVLVVDHHRARSQLPEGCILINPCVDEAAAPGLKALCTVGLTFKIVYGLLKLLRQAQFAPAETFVLRKLLDLVALGTVADLMPLKGENRVFVSFGLKELAQGHRPGVRALLQVAGVDVTHPILPVDVAYKISPRINASGRLADAALPVSMLLSANPRECLKIATELDSMNRQRQEIEKNISAQAEQLVKLEHLPSAGIVVYHPEWHAGVVGIIAGKLCRKYHRPAIVLGQEGALAKGSGRSIPGLNLIEVLGYCETFLQAWGGHPMAVGLSLNLECLDAFREAFCKAILNARLESSLGPSLEISAWIGLEELTEGLLCTLERLHPFGEGNPEPVFGVRSVVLYHLPSVFAEKHVRLQVLMPTQEVLVGIAWNMAHNLPPTRVPVDLAVKLYWNRWNGRQTLQFELIDWGYSRL